MVETVIPKNSWIFCPDILFFICGAVYHATGTSVPQQENGHLLFSILAVL